MISVKGHKEKVVASAGMIVNGMNRSKLLLTGKGLYKAFGGQIVLNNISLSIQQGEVILLQGENGSGKTTLLNILTGNLEPDTGELDVHINGTHERFVWPQKWWRELNPFEHFTPERLAKEGVGRVWQDIRLFSAMTAAENIAVAIQTYNGGNPMRAFISFLTGKQQKQNMEASYEGLARIGLNSKMESTCDRISLGEMKRVAIARAIQAGAKILFLDEPLSGLDKNGISEIMDYLENLSIKDSITLVIVEHVFNIPTVLRLADTVWTLSNGKLFKNTVQQRKSVQQSDKSILQNLIGLVAGGTGTVESVELPNNARLTTITPEAKSESAISLEVKNLLVKRGLRTVINGISLSFKKGQLAILEAPNGWGKSTLFDAIAGVHQSISGSIIVNGEEIEALPTYQRVRKGLAYLRAQQTVFPSLTVREHFKLSKWNRRIYRQINDSSKASFLSGGEKQKLVIDTLREAEVYILDEPFFGLDKDANKQLIALLQNMIKNGKTVIIAVPESS